MGEPSNAQLAERVHAIAAYLEEFVEFQELVKYADELHTVGQRLEGGCTADAAATGTKSEVGAQLRQGGERTAADPDTRRVAQEADGPTRPSSASTDFSEMLKGLPKGPWSTDHSGFVYASPEPSGDLIADVFDQDCARAMAAIPEMLAEIDRLHERLEDNHAYRLVDGKTVRFEVPPGSVPDGIECRDETIKILRENIDRLRARNAEMLELVKPIAALELWRDRSPNYADDATINNARLDAATGPDQVRQARAIVARMEAQ